MGTHGRGDPACLHPIRAGELLAEVTIDLREGAQLIAAVTRSSVDRRLRDGSARRGSSPSRSVTNGIRPSDTAPTSHRLIRTSAPTLITRIIELAAFSACAFMIPRRVA